MDDGIFFTAVQIYNLDHKGNIIILGGVCMYATEMSIRRRDRVTERSSEQMKVPLKKTTEHTKEAT